MRLTACVTYVYDLISCISSGGNFSYGANGQSKGQAAQHNLESPGGHGSNQDKTVLPAGNWLDGFDDGMSSN